MNGYNYYHRFQKTTTTTTANATATAAATNKRRMMERKRVNTNGINTKNIRTTKNKISTPVYLLNSNGI